MPSHHDMLTPFEVVPCCAAIVLLHACHPFRFATGGPVGESNY